MIVWVLELIKMCKYYFYCSHNYIIISHSFFCSWRAYDTNEGREVAWNVVKLNRIPPNERKRIKTEVKLLRDIEHKNVIKYYNSWVDRDKEQIVFITEIMSHGSLKE
jgi:serine/threonine protein kinase